MAGQGELDGQGRWGTDLVETGRSAADGSSKGG